MGGGNSNVTPTSQVDNITITKDNAEITLVPPAKFYAINNTELVLTVTDTENNIYAIAKVVKSSEGGALYRCLEEDNRWLSPGGPNMQYDKVIVVLDAYDKSPEVVNPEFIAWLEAQGFTIPIE